MTSRSSPLRVARGPQAALPQLAVHPAGASATVASPTDNGAADTASVWIVTPGEADALLGHADPHSMSLLLWLPSDAPHDPALLSHPCVAGKIDAELLRVFIQSGAWRAPA